MIGETDFAGIGAFDEGVLSDAPVVAADQNF